MSDQMTLFEQNREDVTIVYCESALHVTLNFKMDRHYEKVFARMILGIYGIKDCKPDNTVNRYSENTSFVITLRDRPGLFNDLPKIQAGIRELAERHTGFVLAQPTQTSLF